MRNVRTGLLAALSLALRTSGALAGDCPHVQTMNGGVDDYPYAMIEFNGELILGGDFEIAGGQGVNHIAKWDGFSWISIGGPLNTVREMALFNGELIATNGGNLLARWNGSPGGWQTQMLPNGMTNAFAVYNNEFIIGGQWFVSGNFINVLRWNFATGQWQAIGAPGTFGTYTVKALAVYDGDLIAGGDFFVLNGNPVAALARWNEAAQEWQPFETGLNNNASVYAMTVYEGDLVVAGAFTHAGGIYSRGVARWNAGDGWQSMAGGVSGHVNALATYNGDLIAGGYFTMAGTQAVNNIARWNASIRDWRSVGDGVTNCCGYGASVYAVAAVDDQLFAGGWFGFGESGPQRVIGWEDCLACPPDISGDLAVDVNDLLAVVGAWGPCEPAPGTCPADITGDGQVNVNDLLAVISAWGPCP